MDPTPEYCMKTSNDFGCKSAQENSEEREQIVWNTA